MNGAASASYRSAAELGDQDPYPPERDGCVLCGLSGLACKCAAEPEPTATELAERDEWERLAWAERDARDATGREG